MSLRNQEGGGIQDRTKSSGRILTTQRKEHVEKTTLLHGREIVREEHIVGPEWRAHRPLVGHPQKFSVRSEKDHLLK